MNYQTQLLPTDDLGHFILARHFARFGAGGEDTREAAHALFGIGHVDAPGRLTGLADLCTMPRAASAAEAERHRSAALIQRELSRSGDHSPSMREMYARNQVAMSHAALLALRDAVWLPRRVAASRHGRLLLGY